MNTTNKNPYTEAEKLGLTIEYTPNLPAGIDGLYTGTHLLIRPHLPHRYELGTLWHELGHHHYGLTHIPHQLSPKLEARCDLYAAEHLINPQELSKLARIYPDEPSRIAYELGVTDRLLNTYIRAHPLPAPH